MNNKDIFVLHLGLEISKYLSKYIECNPSTEGHEIFIEVLNQLSYTYPTQIELEKMRFK